MKKPFPRLKDGEEITPRHLNLIYAELERWNKGSATAGITFDNREGGPLWSGEGGIAVWLAKTNATIPARSGLTLGHADNDVSLYTVNSNGTIADTGVDETAWNWSGGTIASGKFCIVLQVGPLYLLIAVEC